MLQSYKFIGYKRATKRCFVLFLCLFLYQTLSFAQNGIQITIQKKNITIIDALKEVEKQSRLSIGYNDSQLKDKPALNLSLKNVGLENALSTILQETGYTYQLTENYIKIIPQQVPVTTTVKKISGKVVDENNQPLIGVNIRIEGSDLGVITDLNGNFTTEAPIGSTLNFSYIGYVSQTIKVTDKSMYNIQLSPNVEILNEVVVTALGIKREQKALSYNVQQVKADQLTNIKDANFVNSLNGKVAGVVINSSSSGGWS